MSDELFIVDDPRTDFGCRLFEVCLHGITKEVDVLLEYRGLEEVETS